MNLRAKKGKQSERDRSEGGKGREGGKVSKSNSKSKNNRENMYSFYSRKWKFFCLMGVFITMKTLLTFTYNILQGGILRRNAGLKF